MGTPPEASVAALGRALGTLRESAGDLEEGGGARGALPAFAGAARRVGELLWARRAGVPALLAEEIERLASAPAPAGGAPRHEVRRRLARGAAQLAGGVLGGEAEGTNLLLLNEWRARRGARLASEATLFTADLPRTGTRAGEAERGAPAAIGALARELRPRFQEGLAAWLRARAGGGEAGLEASAAPAGAGPGAAWMAAALDRVAGACAGWPGGALWRLAHAWCRGMEEGAIPAGAAGRWLAGRIDRELRRLGEDPGRCLGAVPSAGLLANLLFYLEQGRPGGAESAVPGARFGARHRFRVAGLPDSRKLAFLEHLGAGLAEHAARLESAAGEAALADALDAAADSLGLLGRAGARRRLRELAERLGGAAGDPAAGREVAEGLREVAFALSGAPGSGAAIEHDEAPASASRPPAPAFPATPGEGPMPPEAGLPPPDHPPEDEERLPPRLHEELARVGDVLARLESAPRPGSAGAPPTDAPAMDASAAERAGPATEAGLAPEPGAAAAGEAAAEDPGRIEDGPAVAAAIGRSREGAERECGALRQEIEGLGELVVALRSQVRRLELALGASTGGAAPASEGAAPLLPPLSTGVETLARTQERLSDRTDRLGSLLSRQRRRQQDLDAAFAGARPHAAAAACEVLVVEAGGERVGFALRDIEGVTRLTPSQRRRLDAGEATIEHARRPYRVRHLGALLGGSSEARLPDAPELVLVAVAQGRLALVVDTIVGRRPCVLDPSGRRAVEPPRPHGGSAGGGAPLPILAPEELP